MSPEELDRILSTDQLPASPDFARQVMVRVRDVATEPAPPRFPWFRFLAGAIASGVSATAGATLLPPFRPVLESVPLPVANAAPEIAWATVVLLATAALVSAPRLFADYD